MSSSATLRSKITTTARSLSCRLNSASPRLNHLRLRSQLVGAREMSNRPTTHKFVVWAPDYTDEGAMDRRLAVRGDHLKKAVALTKAGIIKTGGATISPDTYLSTEGKKMMGSMLVFEAESLEAIRQMVQEDVYWTSNVWDKEKLVILPFVPAPIPT